MAHNWSVVCAPAATSRLDNASDVDRAARKHARLWGLSADDDTGIVNGLDNALTGRQQHQLQLLRDKVRGPAVPSVTADALNRATIRRLPDRETTWRQWRVGEDYVGARQEVLRHTPAGSPPVLFGGPTVLAAALQLVVLLGVPIASVVGNGVGLVRSVGGLLALVFVATVGVFVAGGWRVVRDSWRMIRRRAYPAHAYRAITLAVTDVLHLTGRVPRYGPSDITVRVLDGGSAHERFEVSITGGDPDQRRLVLGAVGELLGPVRRPRFLLRVAGGTDDEPTAPRRALARVAQLVAPRSAYLPVPAPIGRRRADAQAFAAAWRRRVGRARLVEIKGTHALATLTEARRRTSARATAPTSHQTWY